MVVRGGGALWDTVHPVFVESKWKVLVSGILVKISHASAILLGAKVNQRIERSRTHTHTNIFAFALEMNLRFCYTYISNSVFI